MRNINLNESLEISGGGIQVINIKGGSFGVNGEFTEQITILIS